MAVKLADAVARLGVDDDALKSGMGQAEGRLSKFGGVMTGAMMGIGLAVAQGVGNALRGAVDNIVESVTLASDLSETVSKTGVLFGDSQQVILDWSTTAATAFGITQQGALDAAANFAIFGKAAGLTGDDLNSFSTDFVGLASDLASFNNTTPEQAIQAIGAALRGESEPLRQYGVLMNDAALKAAAFEMGLTTSNTEALTQQQKILAAQKVIFDQTGAAQGDFTRTADGLANQQRILAAQWTDFKTAMGSAVLPVVNDVTGAVNDMVATVLPPFKDFLNEYVIPAVGAFGKSLGALVDEAGPRIAKFAVDAMASIGSFIDGLKGAADDTTSYADDMGRAFVGSYANIQAQMTGIVDNLNWFAGWFSSSAAENPKLWIATTFAAITAFTEAFGRQVLFITTAARLTGEAMEALFKGDFAGAFAANQAAVAMLSMTGSRVLAADYVNSFRQNRDELLGMWGNETANDYSPYKPQIENSQKAFLPIVINQTINTSADPVAVGQGAQTGVQQALRGAGLQ